MRRSHRLHMLQTAFMAAAMAFPVAAQQQGMNFLGAVAPGDVLERVRDYLPTIREEQRLYNLFHETCSNRMAEDKTVVCPDYRDREAVRAFIGGEWDAASAETENSEEDASTHEAAPALGIQDLDEREIRLLRWYQNTKACPATLQQFLPGFYELCLSMLKNTESRQERRGIPAKVEQRMEGKPMELNAAERRARRMQQIQEGRARPRPSQPN